MDYNLTTPTGVLHGTLTLPDGAKAPFPVALIVAGSGPTDRDGSNAAGVSVKPYLQLAAALAAQGVASVRYDKRGIAASAVSAPLDNPATFNAYVTDVVTWVRRLRNDERFSRVVVIGHSEGSLLALLAAGKVSVDGIVSLEGAGRPAVDVIVEQLRAAGEPDLRRPGAKHRGGDSRQQTSARRSAGLGATLPVVPAHVRAAVVFCRSRRRGPGLQRPAARRARGRRHSGEHGGRQPPRGVAPGRDPARVSAR